MKDLADQAGSMPALSYAILRRPHGRSVKSTHVPSSGCVSREVANNDEQHQRANANDVMPRSCRTV